VRVYSLLLCSPAGTASGLQYHSQKKKTTGDTASLVWIHVWMNVFFEGACIVFFLTERTCVYAWMCAYVRKCTRTCAFHTCVNAHVRVHTCVHIAYTHTHTHTHTCMHAYIHIHNACTHLYTQDFPLMYSAYAH
jgi:hypothetical protein